MSLFYLVPARQAFGFHSYLQTWARELIGRMHILHYEDLSGRRTFGPGTYILSALDQLKPALLQRVGELRRELQDHVGFRFLNDPDFTLHRRALLETLHRRGLNSFRVVPADGDLSEIRFPVFLRVERTHDGAVSPLLRSPGEIDVAIGRAVLRGHRLRDLLVVEFCATAGPDGRYRKYAAFNVDGRIIPQHVSCGANWMQKYEAADSSPEVIQEELEYVRDNPHRDQLARIFKIARAEYGRIDYSLSNGRVETWEINLNPVIGLEVPKPGRENKNAIFFRDLRAAFEALEDPHRDLPGVPLDLEPLEIPDARRASIRRTPARDRILGILEPARPLLEPIARPALPWLGRLARRRARTETGTPR